MSILESSKKHNTPLIVLIIIVVAVISFALGRLSVSEGESQIEISRQGDQAAATTLSELSEIDQERAVEESFVVASKNGTKYHYPWCSGANTISEENKIIFQTNTAARSAGYTPAKNCKGLK